MTPTTDDRLKTYYRKVLAKDLKVGDQYQWPGGGVYPIVQAHNTDDGRVTEFSLLAEGGSIWPNSVRSDSEQTIIPKPSVGKPGLYCVGCNSWYWIEQLTPLKKKRIVRTPTELGQEVGMCPRGSLFHVMHVVHYLTRS